MAWFTTPNDADLLIHYEAKKKASIIAVKRLARKLKTDDLKHYASFHDACRILNGAIIIIEDIKKAHPEWEKSR